LSAPCLDLSKDLWGELWISLVSLLRSYCAAHGLHSGLQATFELDEDRIIARYRDRCLELDRSGAAVTWKREDGSSGTLQLTEAGRLLGPAGEDEMDMAAEAWARELMK
jgi:hypothetical protein